DAFRGHCLSLRVLRTTGSQGSWDCTVVRPTEDHLLFPQMFSVGRVIADPGVAAFRSNQRGSISDRYTKASNWNMRDSLKEKVTLHAFDVCQRSYQFHV